MNQKNLYQGIPHELPHEIVEVLAASRSGAVRIERIVSQGHRSPEGFWYDQDQAEWVLLVQGAASLRFEKNDRLVHLNPGDYLNIAAHEKHRIESTSTSERAIWLAVFY